MIPSMSIMVCAEIRPQMEQLPHDEMVKALAFLRSRLRAETDANRAGNWRSATPRWTPGRKSAGKI